MDNIYIIISIIVAVYFVVKNRKQIRKLSAPQVIGVLLSFVVTVGIAFVCIYFGGNWIADQFPNSVLQSIVIIGVIVLTLIICVSALLKTIAYIVR